MEEKKKRKIISMRERVVTCALCVYHLGFFCNYASTNWKENKKYATLNLNERKWWKNWSFRFALIFSLRLFARPVPGGTFLIYYNCSVNILRIFSFLFFSPPVTYGKMLGGMQSVWWKECGKPLFKLCRLLGDCNDGKCLNCQLYKSPILCVRACSYFFVHIFSFINCGNMYAVVGQPLCSEIKRTGKEYIKKNHWDSTVLHKWQFLHLSSFYVLCIYCYIFSCVTTIQHSIVQNRNEFPATWRV